MIGQPEHRTRGAIDGGQMDFDDDTVADTASIPMLVVFKPDGKFATANIKDYYLDTLLVDKHGRPTVEFTCKSCTVWPISSTMIMSAWILQRSFKVSPQADCQAQDLLVKHLNSNEYIQYTNNPSHFNHKTRDIAFTLMMENFGIMLTRDKDLEHLLTTLCKQYAITEDRDTTQNYVGLAIEHDCVANTNTVSMLAITRRHSCASSTYPRPEGATPPPSCRYPIVRR
jgi:hypothetical protein